jgi:uncharacterized membrane protein YgcG
MPRPIQILLLVIGLTFGAARLGTGLRTREFAKALTGGVVGIVALAAWWFPFSGLAIAGWLVLGFWTWATFSAAHDPPEVPIPEPQPAKADDAPAAPQPEADEPRLFRSVNEKSALAGDHDVDRPRPRRERTTFGGFGGRSSGGGSGGGRSSGGGASGGW